MDYYWIPTKIGKILYFQILFQKYWYTTGFPQKFKNFQFQKFYFENTGILLDSYKNSKIFNFENFTSKILGYYWIPTKNQNFQFQKFYFENTGIPLGSHENSKILFQKYRDTTGFQQKFKILNVK